MRCGRFRPDRSGPPPTVIVLGCHAAPIVETTLRPHMELYKTVNQASTSGLRSDPVSQPSRHASFYFTHDGFGSVQALREHNLAAFGHVTAAKYAFGHNRHEPLSLTPEFGLGALRLRIHRAEIPPDPVITAISA